MLNLLKCEFYKLKRSKSFYVLIVLGIIDGIVGIILAPSLRNDCGKKGMIGMFGGEEFLGQIIFLGIFTIYITNEFKSGYTKNIISYGHKRRDVVLSKSIVFSTAAIIISLILPITVTVIETVMNGYGEIFNFKAFAFILRVTLIMMISYVVMASIAVLISFIFRNIIAPMAIFYLLDMANRFASAFSLRSNDVKYLYEKTIFYIPNIAISNVISISQMVQVVFHGLVVIAFSILLSIYIFNKADIK
ncbi:ABC transporter permease [Clostridium neuense]|uniref:ABC transporter permease n=1 Tax=Clostridium neuense TaxID=1728934 RepID=A0ABW8TLS8_9CLOT